MNRNMLLLAVITFIVVGLAAPFQVVGVPLAPIAALVVGAIAGWWVSAAGTQTAGMSGLKAGAIVGLGALLGSVVGLAVLALWVGNIPEVQAYVQASEPHPEARIPTDLIAPLGAIAGVVVGLIVGVFDLILSTVAGWVAGIIHGHQPANA